ncbi:hypothetical protein [Flavobacterium rhizosphaerae]|uniref:O-antigen ligase like membrane protein n=1 Tax=Flavobacterium rhizosphaerae TaxID=3163298 RepID=A0ABW8YYD3_9FLAO
MLRELEYNKYIKPLKTAIWIYFYLLIFEGALRKWVLPGLSAPLLIVRDPIAIFLIYMSLKKHIWKPNNYVIIMWMITTLSFIMALLAGHGNIVVAIYGLRITFFHFPIIFIIGEIFEKNDIIKMGKVLLWINIGMTLLVGVQFFSPQSAWVNRGLGGDVEGSGFQGTGEYFRVPGTFSFTVGLSLFYGLVAAFILYFWSNLKIVSKYLLIASTIALIFAIPLSISRSVLFMVILSLFFYSIAYVRNIGKFVRGIFIVIICVILLEPLLEKSDIFQTATSAFSQRFTSASKFEGGLEGTFWDRFLGGMFRAITNPNFSIWGSGIGIGSNVAAALGVVRTRIEGEWGRLVEEMGILGFFTILLRFSLVISMLKVSVTNIKYKNILPWMIMSFAFVNILQGQWAQPTSLGFAILSGGLVIAAFNNKKSI